MYVLYDDYSHQSSDRQTFVIKIIDFVFDKDNAFDKDDNDKITIGITKEQDRIMRICCATYHFHKHKICQNKELHKYLKQQTQSHQKFYNISIENMNDHCDKEKRNGVSFFGRTYYRFKSTFENQQKYKNELKDKLNDPTYVPNSWEIISKWGLFLKQWAVWCLAIFLFVLMPVWFITRVFYLSFPVISLINEMN